MIHNDALAIANAAIQIGKSTIKYSRPKSLGKNNNYAFIKQQSMHSLETSRRSLRFLSRSVVSLGLHIRGTLGFTLEGRFSILGYGIDKP
ncbi:hypothetical protein AB6D20_027980 (plasmid) [Vibrio splendidus]